MTEFTGERVIPGAVNDDLWAEHVARYAFAANYAHGGKTLDMGCGTGYGLAELASTSKAAIGIDVSTEAITHARGSYPAANISYLRASASALPFPNATFHLITAFEVIEHLEDWPALIKEARRVLRPDGFFLVSTPNRLYYTASRGIEGPNPFHVHEFSFAEFRDALLGSFPQVVVLQQNRTEAFAFSTVDQSGRFDIRAEPRAADPDQAHFFVAVCAIERQPEARNFLYLPSVSNLLREREQHIDLLQHQLRATEETLAGVQDDHANLVKLHERQTAELEEHNRWAQKVEADWRAALHRIAQVQEELKTEQNAGRQMAEAYAAKVSQLEEENRARAQWALDTEARLSGELARKVDELAEAVRLLDLAEATVVERTAWAQDLAKRLEFLEAQMRMIRESRWIRMGRAVGVGPRVEG